MPRLRSTFVLTAVVLCLFAAPLRSAAAGETKAATPAAENPVLATVNGAKIRLTDVEEARSLLGRDAQQAPLNVMVTPLVEGLIDSKLAADAARRDGIDKDEDVQRMLRHFEDRILQRAYLEHEIKLRTTDKLLHESYKKMLASYPGKEQVKARHILVESESQAREIITELEKGADFVTLAKERSIGPSASKGGDLGYFTHEQMVKPFADAAFALKKGEFTKEPVHTEYGWHVILVEDRRSAEPPSFDEARDQLRSEVAREIVFQIRNELRKKAKIERFNMDGSPREPVKAPKPQK